MMNHMMNNLVSPGKEVAGAAIRKDSGVRKAERRLRQARLQYRRELARFEKERVRLLRAEDSVAERESQLSEAIREAEANGMLHREDSGIRVTFAIEPHMEDGGKK